MNRVLLANVKTLRVPLSGGPHPFLIAAGAGPLVQQRAADEGKPESLDASAGAPGTGTGMANV